MKLTVITAGSGGGHRATARALVDACAAHAWDFTLVDYTDILGVTTRWGDGVYNWLLSTGRMRWMSWLHWMAHVATRFTRPLATSMFRTYFQRTRPDVVVSCCPVINGIVADALDDTVPLVTLLSDFVSSSDHPWIQDPRQYLICGTQGAVKQAHDAHHPTERLVATSGMLVHPSFYAPTRPVVSLPCTPDCRTLCLCFGGVPPPTLTHMVNHLLAMEETFNIVIIGASEPTGPCVFAVGYTEQVASYMSLADVVIGKPGPGVVAEALVLGLPVVVIDHPDHTPPQERAVADWVRSRGVGVVLTSVDDDLVPALNRQRLAACAARVAEHNNMAYKEIPAFLNTFC